MTVTIEMTEANLAEAVTEWADKRGYTVQGTPRFSQNPGNLDPREYMPPTTTATVRAVRKD